MTEEVGAGEARIFLRRPVSERPYARCEDIPLAVLRTRGEAVTFTVLAEGDETTTDLSHLSNEDAARHAVGWIKSYRE